MMEAVRQYIISLISASVVCAILKGILSKGATSKIVDALCGIFLLFTLLDPIKEMDLPDNAESFRWDKHTVQEAIDKGEEMTQNALADIISSKIASYVEEKADALGAEVRAEVLLTAEEIPAPFGIELEGNVGPYVRTQLEAYISENFGLEGEDVRWIVQH